jgi:hypothetical protein
MSSVFVVEAGSYDTFRIVGVFSERDRAQKYADRFKEGQVNEYELDIEDRLMPDGFDIYKVTLYMLGGKAARSVRRCDPDQRKDLSKPYHIYQDGYHLLFEATCCAKSREEAIEKVRHREARWKAEHSEEWAAIIKRCENRNERAERLYKMIEEQDPDWTM